MTSRSFANYHKDIKVEKDDTKKGSSLSLSSTPTGVRPSSLSKSLKSSAPKPKLMYGYQWKDPDGNIIAVSFENVYPIREFLNGQIAKGEDEFIKVSGMTVYVNFLRRMQREKNLTDEEVNFFLPRSTNLDQVPFSFFPVGFAGNELDDILLLKKQFESFHLEADPTSDEKKRIFLHVTDWEEIIVSEAYFNVFFLLASSVHVNVHVKMRKDPQKVRYFTL
jgi:hypothetical protein